MDRYNRRESKFLFVHVFINTSFIFIFLLFLQNLKYKNKYIWYNKLYLLFFIFWHPFPYSFIIWKWTILKPKNTCTWRVWIYKSWMHISRPYKSWIDELDKQKYCFFLIIQRYPNLTEVIQTSHVLPRVGSLSLAMPKC